MGQAWAIKPGGSARTTENSRENQGVTRVHRLGPIVVRARTLFDAAIAHVDNFAVLGRSDPVEGWRKIASHGSPGAFFCQPDQTRAFLCQFRSFFHPILARIGGALKVRVRESNALSDTHRSGTSRTHDLVLNMSTHSSTVFAALLGSTVIATGASAQTVLSFDSIPNLETVTTQAPGLTVSASSNFADSPEQVFSFDFNGFPEFQFAGQQAPFTSGNAVGFGDFGQGLALRGAPGALTGFSQPGGPFPTPLEARRPAGTVNLEFDTALTAFGFTIVDVEGPEEFETGTGFFIDFLSGGVDIASFDFADFVTEGTDLFDSTIVFGNNSANQIQPITAASLGVESFDEVRISLGGSAVIAQVTVTAVPTPTAALGGLALLGAGALRRRTRGSQA